LCPNPVALERMSYDADASQVSYRSDKAAGPTAGTASVDPLEFLARVVTHIPDPGLITRILAHRGRARDSPH
jgi:hypothetical protein